MLRSLAVCLSSPVLDSITSTTARSTTQLRIPVYWHSERILYMLGGCKKHKWQVKTKSLTKNWNKTLCLPLFSHSYISGCGAGCHARRCSHINILLPVKYSFFRLSQLFTTLTNLQTGRGSPHVPSSSLLPENKNVPWSWREGGVLRPGSHAVRVLQGRLPWLTTRKSERPLSLWSNWTLSLAKTQALVGPSWVCDTWRSET